MSPSRTLWRNRDFRLLWAGALVNDAGDWLMMVALPIYVLVETHSGLLTAALLICQLVPATLLGPAAGGLVDRWDLRRTLVLTNVAQAVTLLPLLVVGPGRIWPAFAVAAVQAALTRLNNPASSSILVRVVPDQELTAANAARAASENIARLVGSPLGGIVVAFGGLQGVVLVDGLSFLVVAVTTAMVRVDASPVEPRATEGRPRRPLVAARSVVGRHPPLSGLLSAATVAQVSQGMFVVLFLAFVTRRLGGGGEAVGIVRGMQAVGGILGGLAIARLFRTLSPRWLIAFGFAGMAVWGFVTWNLPAFTTALWVYAALMALAGPAAVACNVGLVTGIQRYSPAAHLGLVIGSVEAAGALGQGVGAVLAGLLVDRVPLAVLLNTQSSLYVVTALVGVIAVRPVSPTAPASGSDHVPERKSNRPAAVSAV